MKRSCRTEAFLKKCLVQRFRQGASADRVLMQIRCWCWSGAFAEAKLEITTHTYILMLTLKKKWFRSVIHIRLHWATTGVCDAWEHGRTYLDVRERPLTSVFPLPIVSAGIGLWYCGIHFSIWHATQWNIRIGAQEYRDSYPKLRVKVEMIWTWS